MLEAMQLAKPQSSTGDVEREEKAILHEITVISLSVVIDYEKLSPLTFWKKHIVYPNLSILARVYLTPHASCAGCSLLVDSP